LINSQNCYDSVLRYLIMAYVSLDNNSFFVSY
jgi:hypothetical protein